jgi:sodium-dependent phosphate cotransporter
MNERITSGPLPSRGKSTFLIPAAVPPWRGRALAALRTGEFLGALYTFLLSVALIGAGFELFGKPFAEALISSTSNPFVGLFVGVLATSLTQSSSCTTSMIVGMVAAGSLTVPNAIPMVMGANIGTTITNTLVSLGHVTRKDEFRRALPGALVHDFFNLMTVAVLLPLELYTHYLERTAGFLSAALWGTEPVKFSSPLKTIIIPVSTFIIRTLSAWTTATPAGIAAIVLGVLMLFGSLWFMTRMMRTVLAGRLEGILDKTIGRTPVLGLVIGALLTAIVQSSSVVTSILVPLAAAGILSVEQIFPMTLGANIGTTVTAILASFAVGPIGLTIALAHLLFNITGIIIIYPIPSIRALPIRMARWFGELAAESKRYAIIYVLGVFFVVPGLLILATKLF